MAARTSASFGVTATIVVLAILTLGFFIAFAVYFGRSSQMGERVAALETEQREVIGAERNRDDVRLLQEAARRENKSLVAYLVENREALVRRISGDRRDTLASIDAKLAGVEGNEQPLLSIINGLSTQLSGSRGELAQASAARDRALADLAAEVARVKGVEETHRRTLDEVNQLVASYRQEVEQYRTGADQFRQSQSAQVERVRSEAEEAENRLQEQIKQLTEQKLILEAQVSNLRGQRAGELFKGGDEAALVDGEIIGINDADRTVVINRGRDRKVVLGMTFAVYNNAGAIKLDDRGNYTAGKANLEVINVGESTSTARITSELRGNPVARGDVIANAVYDPNKVYKFVVFGNFDTDRDGISTSGERDQVASMIQSWGGIISEELQGDTDFLVLGARPTLPPRPGSDAPLEVALEFTRRFREVERYDSLQRQAAASGIPALNENRLYTLIGRTPPPVRR